jgi:iron-sulfur cluster repair protein YtfE (RIC family)
MTPVRQLYVDHGLIRSKLDSLQEALVSGPAALRTVLMLVPMLRQQLTVHEQREEACLYPLLYAQLQAGYDIAEHPIYDEHTRHQALLEQLQQLLHTHGCADIARITVVAEELRASVIEHMVWEEQELFPALTHELAIRGIAAQPVCEYDYPVTLNGAMTVSLVIQRYPETRYVFER